MVTSARPTLRREEEPLKMTSAISPPRRLLADCSPRIQRTASTMLDLPEPFGPTIAVMPGANSIVVLSAKLLKPISSRLFSMALGYKKRGSVTQRGQGRAKHRVVLRDASEYRRLDLTRQGVVVEFATELAVRVGLAHDGNSVGVAAAKFGDRLEHLGDLRRAALLEHLLVLLAEALDGGLT